MLIDTHMHLNDAILEESKKEVIERAFQNNVRKMFIVGYNKESCKKAIELANEFDCCYTIVGFHPTEIKNYSEEDYEWLKEIAQNNKVVAIGEIGYDFHWDTTTLEEQRYAFMKQIKIAKELHLPISIHSRDAIQLTLDTLKESKASSIGGVMHSFSGSVEMAHEFIKQNFLLGISGPVTFKNGRTMKEVVKEIDLKYLLTETDSPYLTPHPYRGQVNYPEYILLIANEIAKIKDISLEEVEKQIEENTKKLFGV